MAIINFVKDKITYISTPFFFNICLSFFGAFILWLIYCLVSNNNKTRKLLKITPVISNSPTNKKLKNLRYLKKLKNSIEGYYTLKERKRQTELYGLILFIEILLFVLSIMIRIPLFAFIFPLMFHWFAIQVLRLCTITVHDLIQENLSDAIKQMIKIFSKTNDLKTVIYEVSKTMEGPLRVSFFELSRKMISGNYETILADFADEIDDIWLYAFIFLLINYKGQSKKEDILLNLKGLSGILDNQNFIINKNLIENRTMAVMNWAIFAVAIVAFLANLVLNKYSEIFFFHSIGGMICFCLGIFALLCTVIINLKLVNKNRR